LERLKLRRLIGRGRRAPDAQVVDHILDLDLRRLHVQQECLARLVLKRGDARPRIATHLERPRRRVAVDVERDLEGARRDVRTAKTDVVRRNRQLNERLRATATTPSRPTSAASTTAAATRGVGCGTTTTAAFFTAAKVASARRRRWRHVPKIPHCALNHVG